ncbi:UNVERIFIED_ORG: hypothetical protein M2348_000707 [Sphingomonas sp. R1F5B]
MTVRARLTEAEMRRVCRAVAAAKFSRATIIMDFQNQRIEVVVGDGQNTMVEQHALDEWTDDDV